MATMKRKGPARAQLKVAPAGLKVPAQELLPLADVNMAAYNPRVMPAEKMRALKASMVKHGMVLNLVVQRRGMVLIGGHQRVTAMRELCHERGWALPEKVPAAVLDVGDPEAKLLNVALNNIDGDFDPYKLGELFASISPTATMDDFASTGFLPDQVEELMKLVKPIDEQIAELEAGVGEIAGFAKSITLSVEFESTDARDAAKASLLTAAKAQGRKAGMVLLDALRAQDALGGKRRKKVAA